MNIDFRQASIEDLPAIIRMLAEDGLGRQREHFEFSAAGELYQCVL